MERQNIHPQIKTSYMGNHQIFIWKIETFEPMNDQCQLMWFIYSPNLSPFEQYNLRGYRDHEFLGVHNRDVAGSTLSSTRQGHSKATIETWVRVSHVGCLVSVFSSNCFTEEKKFKTPIMYYLLWLLVDTMTFKLHNRR